MLKLNEEEFDKCIEYELTNNKECYNLISTVKKILNQKDDSLINSLTVKVFEIAYQSGFKEGMDFIVNRKDIDILP